MRFSREPAILTTQMLLQIVKGFIHDQTSLGYTATEPISTLPLAVKPCTRIGKDSHAGTGAHNLNSHPLNNATTYHLLLYPTRLKLQCKSKTSKWEMVQLANATAHEA
jgi:hypothetical protein